MPYNIMLKKDKGICRICDGTNTVSAFKGLALEKHRFHMRLCRDCGYLYIDDPYWLPEAYSSPIAACDTGLVSRNISIATRLQSILFHLFGGDGDYLDVAGGTGLLVRLMRDQGFEFNWHDPYCANIHALGFEREPGKRYTAVTAFEVLEHLEDPVPFLQDILRNSSAEVLICSTELYKGKLPEADWWYYAFSAGQHIAFYQKNTLRFVADKLGVNEFSQDGFHYFGDSQIIARIKKYYDSRIIRYMAKRRMKGQMHSKITDDHQRMLKQSKINI